MTATVISVETAEEDAEYMMHLMREADEKGKIRGTFIESRYHLSATPKRLIISLNNQNHFLNNIRAIMVVGIKEEIMNKRMEIGGEHKVMREYLLEKFQLGGIERTSQTENLGKWYFLTTQEDVNVVKRKVDWQLSKLFQGNLEEEEKVPGINLPRRNNGPTMDERHEAYLEQIDKKMGFSKDVETEEVVIFKADRRQK